MDIPFHPLSLGDKALIRSYTQKSYHRNCDLSFMNLMSWRFLYDTEVAEHNGWLLFRFRNNGHLCYLAPLGKGCWHDIVQELLADARKHGEPFLMLGVTERTLTYLNAALPNYFYATADRDFTDYIYFREKMATLAGKKLQPKRNHINQFLRLYPNHEYLPLTKELIPACLELEERWAQARLTEDGREEDGYAEERRSVRYVFEHWDELDGTGGVLRIDGRIVAFTAGAPINGDTFDICIEKADKAYEGAYTFINREFARRLPEKYVYVNREEDLGIPGLRHAKNSYRPDILLHKFAVMVKHPFGTE